MIIEKLKKGVIGMSDIFFWEVHQLEQCLAVLRHCKTLDEVDYKFCEILKVKKRMVDNPDNYLE